MINFEKGGNSPQIPTNDAEKQSYFNDLYNYAANLLLCRGLSYNDAKECLRIDKQIDDNTASAIIDDLRIQIEEARRANEEKAAIHREEVRERKKKRNKIIAIGAAVIIAVLFIYNLPYFKEKRAYDDVVTQNTLTACNSYLIDYPDGAHADDVMYLRAKLDAFHMPFMVEYLQKFPAGKYAQEINGYCDQMWDEEISKYENSDKSRNNPQAVAYFSEMLQFMKQHRINQIIVDVNPQVNLTDWSEYRQDVRDYLESMNEEKNKPLDSYIVSIRDNFTKDDQSSLTDILVEGVQNSLNKIFSENFISITKSDSLKNSMPKLTFDYSIESQEYVTDDGIRIPHIWTYVSNGVTENYLIGIGIYFKAHFSLPHSNTTYDYSEKGEPEDDINNIEDIKDGYRIMTSICFAKFSNKMSNNLGLAEVYFQGNGTN